MKPGKYMATVVSHGIKRDEGRSPELWITFQNEFSEELTWFSGMGYTKDGFSAKAFDYCKNALKALGWDAEENGFDFAELAIGEVLKGRVASIVVADEVYNGETRTKVKYINDPNRAVDWGTVDPKSEAAFFADLRANAFRAKASGGAQPASRPAQQRPAGPSGPAQRPPQQTPPQKGIEYDDIPFAWLLPLLAVGLSTMI